MLDTFFRKYAWLANAALLVAAAWLTARTVNTVVAASIRPRPQVDLSALPPAPPAIAQANLDNEKLYALFGQKPPRPPDPTDNAKPPPPLNPQNCADRRAAPTRSGLRAQLVAGVLSERPEWSIASITDLNTRETRIYGVGDTVMGARFLGMERIKDPQDLTGAGFRVIAVVCNAGTKEYVDFDGGSGATAGPVPLPAQGIPTMAPVGSPDLSGIKKLAENRYEIPKGVIERSLTDLNAIATQARIVPSFKNGVANGFKLFSIQPGSLYSSIGIDNGDVIQRINGYEINSPDKALEIYQKLKDAGHITIDIERNGQTLRKDYNVTP